MNIAELFVNLGLKGAEKTLGTLGSVKSGLGSIKDTSLEAKAAIVGMMYGLERMMAISGNIGTSLTNFSALTGKSAQELQKWQFAARQAGVSGEELTASFQGVQNSIGNMLMGKGAPEGIALLSKSVGGLDPTRYRDTFYMLTKLQEGLQKMAPEMSQIVGKSFGLSEGTIAAMRRNAFTPDMLGKAPTYSDKELSSLDKSNIAWSNLSNKIQMAFGHFNAKHGQGLVGDISKTVDQVFKLAESFEKLAEKLKVFDLINEIFKGWGFIFSGIGEVVDKLSGFGGKEQSESVDKKGNLKKNPLAMMNDWLGGKINDYFDYQEMKVGVNSRAIAPLMPHQTNHDVSNNTTINQNIIHHGDAKDTRSVKDSHKSAIQHAYRQRSAQRQGS